jgi:1-acyl-sn-glycerol-3-phosphate acyltransferase
MNIPARAPHSSPLRALWRAAWIILWLLLMLPLVLVFWLLRQQRVRGRLVQLFLRVLCAILRLRITVHGTLSQARPLLIVANHASYADVFVLGSKLPVSFTPKREVRSWPGIGFLCVLADCVFVERRRSQMQEAREEMQARIEDGRVLCIFPEGTTNNGRSVKPFKSGFLSLAEERHLPVQPATIAYTHVNDAPLDDAFSDHVAWVGEATFFAHFSRLLGYRSIDAQLHLGEALLTSEAMDRKAITLECEQEIRSTLEHSIRKIQR